VAETTFQVIKITYIIFTWDIKGPANGSKNKKVSEVKISLLFVSPKKEKKKKKKAYLISNSFLFFSIFTILRVMAFCSNPPMNVF
jgi:hypothetical protein